MNIENKAIIGLDEYEDLKSVESSRNKELAKQIEEAKEQNNELKSRNIQLQVEIEFLKNKLEAVENENHK